MAHSPVATSTELSVYDAVSRSVRWFRTDMRLFCKRFLLVVFIYNVIWHLLYWLGENLNVPNAVFAVGVLFAALVMVQFEIGSRILAFWRVSFGKEADFAKALTACRQPRVFLLFGPIIISDLFMAVVALSTQLLTQSGQNSDKVLALFVWLLILILVLPLSCLVVWTSFWAYVSETENCSPGVALKKVFQWQAKAPFSTLWIFVFFGSAMVALQLPFELFESLTLTFSKMPFLPEWLLPIAKEVFEVSVATICQLLLASYQVCSAAFIHRMLKMRFDGIDIAEKLNEVQSRAD